jgi:glycosyltransferase involved in cell wall biosynthesis
LAVKDKNSFFNQIDIFCLPSTSEPFGIILLEAIERSKPIIATSSGGPQEIIRDKQDGLIAKIESPEDLAVKIKLLINDKKMADEMSKSAYNRIKENYDIKIVSKKLSETLIGINK